MFLNVPLDGLGWSLMPYSIFLRGSLYLGGNHRIWMGKIDHADYSYNISWKTISLENCMQYAVCCAAVFVMALEAIHTGFYFHNDFLIQFQSYWILSFLCGSCLFFVPSIVPFHCLLIHSVVFQKLKWLYKLGIQFLHLVLGCFWLIYQLFKPMSVSFVFWSLLERQCLTLSLYLYYSFFHIEVREWLFHCVWLNNCTEYLFTCANIKTVLLALMINQGITIK